MKHILLSIFFFSNFLFSSEVQITSLKNKNPIEDRKDVQYGLGVYTESYYNFYKSNDNPFALGYFFIGKKC